MIIKNFELPFINYGEDNIRVLKQVWKKSDNEILELKTVGGSCFPGLREQELILMLLDELYKNRVAKVRDDIKEIKVYFTIKELQKKFKIKNGDDVENFLDESLKVLNEVTMYIKYIKITDSKSIMEKSFRIIDGYSINNKNYSYVRFNSGFIELMKNLNYK
ncbi:hypothetical protein [Clostridium baratii]|uniref:hypothetical protein n=1 Tax=Clostridium baratii TaxID=1561 RepID=UPI0022E7C8B2|nr:hypothetical protein [Clostridium baratii]